MTENSETFPTVNGRALARRAAILFANFFLIILAYYQVKSASRSLFIEYWGAERVPQLWIVSALVLGSFIGVYHNMVERFSRLQVVLGSCALFIVLLVLFHLSLAAGSAWGVYAFYIFVDILSVILVEQFWSLANTVNATEDGKKSYWFVGTGGLVGGALGGAMAAALVRHTPVATVDLPLVCAALIGVIFLLNLLMGRHGLYDEVATEGRPVIAEGGWRTLVQSRYLLLIAAALLCAQFAQPIVEYQFLRSVEAVYKEREARTAFFGDFFAILGIVSIIVNLTLTPVLHRYAGVIVGLLAQPILLMVSSLAFMLQPTLLVASIMKISDRGLSYSINRASKELLYIPVDPVHTYQAKAWIDMLGYRLFKVSGSSVIWLLTEVLPKDFDPGLLSWLTFGVCTVWFGVIVMLVREYNAYEPAPPIQKKPPAPLDRKSVV